MPEQCDSHMSTGGRCDLPAGHSGKHEKAYPNATFRWSDTSVRAFIDDESRKPLGT